MSEDLLDVLRARESRRWWALAVLCLGVLMVAMNATVVSVSLASIGLDLGFSEASLVWIVNAHLATFGGFLLLGARLGDFYGRRRVFLLGIAIFTLASCGCGLANSPAVLIASRAAQGLGGAIVSATALTQVANLFEHGPLRVKALGVYVFVSASGGSIGLVFGGLLASTLGWSWIFLANVPVGLGIYGMCIALLPADGSRTTYERVDLVGALTVTASLILTIYAIVNSRRIGWNSAHMLIVLGIAGALLLSFVYIETRAQAPLVPLNIFREGNLAAIGIIGIPLSAAVLAWRYTSALYLQLVLQLDPLQVGLAFLPANLMAAMVSLVVSPAIVTRFGTRLPFAGGMLVTATGLALLAQAPVDGDLLFDVLPGMLLVGFGTSVAYNPLYVSALSSVTPPSSGVASGIVNTSLCMGGAIGLSALAAIATARTDDLLRLGVALRPALNGGYQVALYSAALLAALAAIGGGVFPRGVQPYGDPQSNVNAQRPR